MVLGAHGAGIGRNAQVSNHVLVLNYARKVFNKHGKWGSTFEQQQARRMAAAHRSTWTTVWSTRAS